MKDKNCPLPKPVPEFPFIDQQEHSVVHFILRESFDSVKQWVATINLEDLSLEYKLYENAIKEPNTDMRLTTRLRTEPCSPASFASQAQPNDVSPVQFYLFANDFFERS
jgi:hypothetical protein